MSADDLHRPLYVPDLLANVLNQGSDRPLLHLLDGPTLSVAEVRDATSQYVQALIELGVGRGSRVGLLSPNRPEVLHVSHATQLLAAIYMPMHPMGGLADHLHVIEDGGVELLIFNAAKYAGRAAELAERSPGLRLVAFGETPLGGDLCALAERFAPQRLVPPRVEASDIARMGYSGGTTGKP
jgi:fatty-acyl-CoA synthase